MSLVLGNAAREVHVASLPTSVRLLGAHPSLNVGLSVTGESSRPGEPGDEGEKCDGIGECKATLDLGTGFLAMFSRSELEALQAALKLLRGSFTFANLRGVLQAMADLPDWIQDEIRDFILEIGACIPTARAEAKAKADADCNRGAISFPTTMLIGGKPTRGLWMKECVGNWGRTSIKIKRTARTVVTATITVPYSGRCSTDPVFVEIE